MVKKPVVLLLLGMPGTGKGTQGALLSKYLKCDYLIAGDYIREVYKEGPIDDLHKDLIATYDRGELVKDETVVAVFKRMISQQHAKTGLKKGVMFDAYPMSMDQVQSVEDFVKAYDMADPLVLFIEVTEEEILKRIGKGRLVCVGCKKKYGVPDKEDLATYCQKCAGTLTTRPDDKPEIVLNRFRSYAKRLAPILGHYQAKNQLVRIRGEQEIESVFADIILALKKKKIINDNHKKAGRN